MGYDFKSLTKQADEAVSRNRFYTDFEDVDPNELHQISDLTEWIRTKGKGSDVREVIAQLFERTWVEGINRGNSNAEVSQARGSFDTLAYRLNNFEGIIKSKADDSKVIELLRNVIDGSPKGTYSNMSALKQAHPKGTQGVFITTDNKNWNYWNGSSWVAGGVYQANMTEFSANQVTEGKVSAYIKAARIDIDIDAMSINVADAVVVDGANNIWPGNYQGSISSSNGFLVYKKEERIFEISPIDNFDKNNIILGLIWSDGTSKINSIFPYTVKKGGVTREENTKRIKEAIVTGDKIVSIDNFTFSHTPRLLLDKSQTVWNVVGPEINRVDGATSGFVLYNANDKKLYLKKIETPLSYEPDNMYLISILWGNGMYTENGLLKNKQDVIQLQDLVIENESRIIVMGDSIAKGLKAYSTPRTFYDKPWPSLLNNYYGGTVQNVSASGKSITGTSSEDYNGQIAANNFANFDLAIIAFGTNDFNNQSPLDDIKTNLKKGLDKIFSDNPTIKVAGVLPHNFFRLPFTEPANTVYVDALKYADRNGNTLNDVCDAIASIYDEYYIPYIDWRKAPVLTLRNYNKWTWDAVHPNEEGHALIARRIGEWLKINV